MPKQSRLTDEQIIAILHGQEAGTKMADVCRRHGISEATFSDLKAKFGGNPGRGRQGKLLCPTRRTCVDPREG